MSDEQGGLAVHSPFERVTTVLERPRDVVEPRWIAWNAVVFELSGPRQVVACVPRGCLDAFLDQVESGALDDSIVGFLETAPSNRVLRSSDQTGSPGLFDELATSDAVVPPDRRRGHRPAAGGRGGSPREARRNKRQRRPRRRLLRTLTAIVVVGALIGVGVAVALNVTGSSDSKAKPSTPAPTTPDGIAATTLEGTWTVTRTVSDSDNPLQPAGGVSVVTYTVTKDCGASPCTLHVEAPGSFGALEQSNLTFVTDHYEGPVTGTSPCLDDTGNANGFAATITGSVVLATLAGAANQFAGTLQLHLQSGVGCEDVDHNLTYALSGAKT